MFWTLQPKPSTDSPPGPMQAAASGRLIRLGVWRLHRALSAHMRTSSWLAISGAARSCHSTPPATLRGSSGTELVIPSSLMVSGHSPSATEAGEEFLGRCISPLVLVAEAMAYSAVLM